METWKPIPSSVDKFFSKYEGYISSHNWHRADENELARLAMAIREKE
jgi:histidine triad (HIT) family protein